MSKTLLKILNNYAPDIAVAVIYIAFLFINPRSDYIYPVYLITILQIFIFELLFIPLFKIFTVSQISLRKNDIKNKLRALCLSTVIFVLYYNILHSVFKIVIFTSIWILIFYIFRKNTENLQ